MPIITESTVEAAALSWFEGLGYDIPHGPDIVPGESATERSDYTEGVLENRLCSALSRLNPNVPELSDDELAFYDALEVNDSAVKVLGDHAIGLFETAFRSDDAPTP